MKHAYTIRTSANSGDLLRRRLFEEFIYGDLRIASDNEPFLSGAGFTFFALRLGLFGHLVLLSVSRLRAASKVPQPGIEPGRPFGSRECKSRLSTSSSTGAFNKALNAGTVEVFPGVTVPAWFFGPISAALLPSSWDASYACRNSERNVFIGNGRPLPLVIHGGVPIFLYALCLIRIRKTAQNLVNRSHLRGHRGQIIALVNKFVPDLLPGHLLARMFENKSNRVRDAQVQQVAIVVKGKIGEWGNVRQNLIKVRNLVADFGQLIFQLGTAIKELMSFLPEVGMHFREVCGVHHDLRRIDDVYQACQ